MGTPNGSVYQVVLSGHSAGQLKELTAGPRKKGRASQFWPL
jgi:hypothetical protein